MCVYVCVCDVTFKLYIRHLFSFRLVEDLDLCIMSFDDYSKEFVKSCKISPDVYIQLALQLTYFR